MSLVSPPSTLQIWILAARPKTLPAAAAPVIVGAAVAAYESSFRFLPVLAALLGALLIQIGTNLANDVFDFKKGADTGERLGPTRVTQAGLLSPTQVMTGMWLTFFVAVLSGIYLVWIGGWPIVAIGLISIAAGIAYTGGPYPLGYNGLGDLFVFIFFGLVAVCGTYYVQALTISPLAVWSAVPMGFLATAILVVNNLRDIDTDAKAGKRTLAVRFGRKGARIQYVLMLALSYLCLIWMGVSGLAPIWIGLTLLALVRAIPLITLIFQETGAVLNKALAGTGRLELEFGLLLSAGLLLGLWLSG
jgi:1,4-dihydroxy-2-naphthoate octaprenyltransferase